MMTHVQVSWTKFLVRVSRTRNLDRLSGALEPEVNVSFYL